MTSSVHSTFNNQIVDALRQGGRDRVEALLGFGISPEKTIDLVHYAKSTAPSVTTRSAWFWSHQAPREDGVMAWWDWLDRHLENMPVNGRSQVLAKLFMEAMEAGAPQEQGRTVAATWTRALDWASEERAPRWTRQMMFSCLASVSAKLGNQAVNGLYALERNLLITRNDWTLEARQRYPQDPLSSAVSKVQVDLVELLLDMGCEPFMQNGKPILAEAWAGFEASFSAAQQQFSNDEDFSALLLERLLARDLDWNVPSVADKAGTVAMEAERWLNLVKIDSPRWDGVSRQIEAKILNQRTKMEPRGAISKPKPRL